MQRRPRKRNKKLYLAAILSAVVIVVAVVVGAIYLNSAFSGRPSAAQYFQISPTLLQAKLPSAGSTDNDTIVVSLMAVTLTPMINDAKGVLVQVPSHPSDDESNQAENITKGVAYEFDILMRNYVTHLTAINGTYMYPIRDVVYGSLDCNPTEVTLYFAPENVIIL